MATIRMGPLSKKMSKDDTEWEETGRNVISCIIVSYCMGGVTSIQFGFIENGALVMSKTYGSSLSTGFSTRILRLNHESEFITGITGETHKGFITSLTFHTNQRTLEAVHLTIDSTKTPEKKEFHSGILERREFLGFFGSYYGGWLTSIGFYVKLVILNVKTISSC